MHVRHLLLGQIRDFEPNRYSRTQAGRGLDTHMSVRQPRPLVDAPQPKAASVLTHVLEIESPSIVGDRQHHLVSGTAQDDNDLVRPCMLRDVAERLLGDSIQTQGRRGVDGSTFGF